MPQFALPFKYEEETNASSLTGFAGLPLYMELMYFLKLIEIFRKIFDSHASKNIAWNDSDVVLALVLLNLAGGDHVEDVRILEKDAGFSVFYKKFSTFGLKKLERDALQKKRQQQGSGALPSRSTVFRFLKQDGADGLEQRGQGKAYIPSPSMTTQKMHDCNKALLAALEHNRSSNVITLDMDATLIETHKEDALYSYKGYAAYQPMNVWWDEHQVVLYTQFRDGNVPANYELQTVLHEALSCLPEGTAKKQVRVRVDAAGYDISFLKYCDNKKIHFAVGCPISESLRSAIKAVPENSWQKLDKLREYAEVCFVPSSLSTSKRGHEFRYIAIRELLKEQCVLPGFPEKEYPFPVEELACKRYKIHAVVTNMNTTAKDLIPWYYKRCGHSEEAHAVLKNELASGVLPSNNFHANAIWWWIAVISINIHSMFKRLCCDANFQSSRLKRIRFHIINIPGRVLERGRQLYIRLTAGHPSFNLYQLIRESIVRLRPCPA